MSPIPNVSPLLTALGAIFLWSSLAVLSVFLKAYPPLFVTGVALCFGSLCSVHAMRRWPVPPLTLLLGVVGLAGYHAALFVAFRKAPAVEANLLNYLWPTLIVLLSPVLLKGSATARRARCCRTGRPCRRGADRLRRQVWLGCALSCRLLVGCGAALTFASYSLLLRRVPPFANDAVGLFCLVSGLVCLAAHGLWEPEVSVRTIDWLWLALLGLGPMGASFFLWNHAMRHGDPRAIGALAYLTRCCRPCCWPCGRREPRPAHRACRGVDRRRRGARQSLGPSRLGRLLLPTTAVLANSQAVARRNCAARPGPCRLRPDRCPSAAASLVPRCSRGLPRSFATAGWQTRRPRLKGECVIFYELWIAGRIVGPKRRLVPAQMRVQTAEPGATACDTAPAARVCRRLRSGGASASVTSTSLQGDVE